MNQQQQQAALAYARDTYCGSDKINMDADTHDSTGFDPVEDGVWVKAWVWVPADRIPGYQMEPPAPAATVEVVSEPIKPMGYSEFKDAYIDAYNQGGDDWTMAALRASWAAYQRDPAGHFLSKK